MAKKLPNRTDHEQKLIDLLAQRIRKNRGWQELTHEKLGEKCGISPRNIAAMQAAEVNIRFTTLARLKKALKLKSWDDLLPDWDDVEVKKVPQRKKTVKKAAKKKVVKRVSKSTVNKTATTKAARKALKNARKKATKKQPVKSTGGSKKK